MKLNTILLGYVATILFIGCGGVSQKNNENVYNLTTSKQKYLEVINRARDEVQNCGEYGTFPATQALTWNEKLYRAAYEHSNDMAIANISTHAGSGQESDITGVSIGGESTASQRIEAQGYEWSRYGENIAAGTDRDTPEEAVKAWLESPEHCKNLMNPNFKEVGMAIVKNSNSQYVHYWTQVFGTPR